MNIASYAMKRCMSEVLTGKLQDGHPLKQCLARALQSLVVVVASLARHHSLAQRIHRPVPPPPAIMPTSMFVEPRANVGNNEGDLEDGHLEQS